MGTTLKLKCSSYIPRVIRIGNRSTLKNRAGQRAKVRRLTLSGSEPKRRVEGLASAKKGRLVDFQLYHPRARSVQLAGNFLDGDGQTIPLEHLGGGAWLARLLLAPGRYEYHYIVDGERQPDPTAVHAVETAVGVVNSVIRVE